MVPMFVRSRPRLTGSAISRSGLDRTDCSEGGPVSMIALIVCLRAQALLRILTMRHA